MIPVRSADQGQPAAGPRNPIAGSPPRTPGSWRRTTTIDTIRGPDLVGPATMRARARDRWTRADGQAEDVASASIDLRTEGDTRNLLDIATEPLLPGVQDLLGAMVGPGFRAKVERAVPDQRDGLTLLYLLLDDLPGAALVSGYALLRAGLAGDHAGNDAFLDAQVDLCSGWASDSVMMGWIRQHGRSPTPGGPPAPDLVAEDDPSGWHTLPPLPPGAMRRARRLDVAAPRATGDPWQVDAHFRDSHQDPEEGETVVHEYRVRAEVAGGPAAGAGLVITGIGAEARVLPWVECPQAVASASRLAGHELGDLRGWVRSTFVGTSTCTHLNDTLRSLTDVGALIDELRRR